jgi:uncharacterized CHY-type Zn-finger protein
MPIHCGGCGGWIADSEANVKCPYCGSMYHADCAKGMIHKGKYVTVCGRCRNKFTWSPYKDNSCFIATAAYGTPLAPEIQVLRNWRDNSLIKTKHGRLFVDAYYRISPTIAKNIEKSEKKKTYTRLMLTPIVKYFKKREKLEN